ncbi:proteasome ATPase [uncultured Mobiluncus sp.]|uniref:proteasome ATPase n=1 Tax=uncultured Mobiluncus sp. TaxID=293425 RepID=UPI00260C86DA|nr:proteasome ATPase [uncultured Mobiluncus sp.]
MSDSHVSSNPSGQTSEPQRLENQNTLLASALAQAQSELKNLRKEIQRLQEPPLTHGTVVKLVDSVQRLVDVSVMGRRFRVTIGDTISWGRLQLGDTILLNDKMVGIGRETAADTGVSAVVLEHVDTDRILVTVNNDSVRLLRLSDRLHGTRICPGDTLLVDLQSGFAQEYLARPEIEGLELDDNPGVNWDQIGGLESVLTLIRETIELPMTHPELYESYQLRPPKGILLYGPPGVGKTMIAKAIATSLSEMLGKKAHFLNIKGPELLDKYVGETERRVRAVFSRAREKSANGVPVIVFFDEMEALFRTRGTGVSSDVETTVVPQLLAEIDGVEELRNVVIVGASNREDLIDPAIVRPGRLDMHIRIPRPNKAACTEILGKYLREDLPYAPGAKPAALRDEVIEKVFTRDAATAILRVTRKSGKEETWYLSDLVSGAMLASIVEKAKARAVQQALRGEPGIRLEHLLAAIRDETAAHQDLPGVSDPEEWARIVGRSKRLDPILDITPMQED